MIVVKGLNIKNLWNEISLSEYADIKSILSSENYNDFEKELRIMALLAGQNDPNIFDTWLKTEAQELFEAQKFLQEEPQAELKEYYTIGGHTYKLIKEFDTLETWQFIDLTNILKDKEHSEQRLHELVSLFLRKIAPLSVKKARNNLFIERLSGSKKGLDLIERWNLKYEEPDLVPFSGELSKETAENIFNNLSFADANAISVFFYLLSSELLKTALDFLETERNLQLKSALQMLKEESKTNKKLQPITNQLEGTFQRMVG